MKRIALALGALSILSAAYAQDTTTKPDAQTPAVATPDTNNPAAPVPGANSFTEGQAKERIEGQGYTDVSGLTKGEDGIWTGTAMKDGKSVEVKLDFQGNITASAK
ncbi:Peptidase propeptide and YPEB domain-containing protein [Phyllobacterium sp. YR620]|uniref:PepSY domain-containing protein n=1 Tax=Phyllobacterium pellucidum TaxID=2740464 RepID=A0A849VY79_9HYPH|nr:MULTISPECIES: PepSY domain-containing protein [Phyllobacterium]NTS33267.1 PepSY domain-containing protein [Phyllobacterium pellucidum]SDP88066.1 Peptidase propeptide and YPEB domain-containing protein [Phyllobacterium sp. YR620]SFJ40576.1 Peptidase propeptide and YPEB domain-containing protein [Phyllobacterium sp. CL33Tsu]